MNKINVWKQKFKFLDNGFDEKKMSKEDEEKLMSVTPKSLFKYKKIDENMFDMIEKNYFYLSKITVQDDFFDAAFSYDKTKTIFSDLEILERCFFKLINDYKDKINKEELMDFILARNYNPATDVNTVNNNVINKKTNIEELTTTLYNRIIDERNRTRICSLTTINNSQIMWEMYGDKYKGCCIEYEFHDNKCFKVNGESSIDIFPVIYDSSNRFDFYYYCYSYIVLNIFNGKKDSNYILKNELVKNIYKLFFVKNEEWLLQDEWRLIGYDEKVNAPKIKAIYLGSGISKKNKTKILNLSSKYNIDLYDQTFDENTLSIKYKSVNTSMISKEEEL